MIEGLPSRIKEKFGNLENTGLFETKILRLRKTSEADRILLVASRDPGSSNAIIPVLKELKDDEGLGIEILTDGYGQKNLQNSFETENVDFGDMVLGADTFLRPQAVLVDRSAEMGIEMYTVATFPEVPVILIEDYYTSSIHFLKELKKRNLWFPVAICVDNEQAKDAIAQELPELTEIIEVTGQPALDRFAHEDTETSASEIKDRLGIKKDDTLVTYMSTIDGPEKIERLAESIKDSSEGYYLAFRRHPRDNFEYEKYIKILTDRGIKIIDTESFTTDEVAIASDIILTTWSTEGLHGIYRKKPTVHIIDDNFPIPEDLSLPLPQVSSGASVGIDSVNDVKNILPLLLDTQSDLNKELKANMDKHYHLDGKNAERVASVVRKYV